MPRTVYLTPEQIRSSFQNPFLQIRGWFEGGKGLMTWLFEAWNYSTKAGSASRPQKGVRVHTEPSGRKSISVNDIRNSRTFQDLTERLHGGANGASLNGARR